MKRIFGLLLVVLAVAGMVNVVRSFSKDDGQTSQSSRSAAYDAGKKVGRYSAPGVLVVLGLLGLRWLLQSDDMRPAAPAVRRNPVGTRPLPRDPSLRGGQDTVAKPGLYPLWGQAGAGAPVAGTVPEFAAVPVPARPWYRTAPGIIVLSLLGVFLGAMLLVTVLPLMMRGMSHRRANSFEYNPRRPRPMPRAATPSASQWTQTGPYTVGAAVEAQWAGRWIPGKINSINPGGFSVMVQLEDSRFPQPLVLSTNQIRLR